MILRGIKIEGIPEGWEPVRYGIPKRGEFFMGTSDYNVVAECGAGSIVAGHRLIVRKKPTVKVEATWAGPLPAKEGFPFYVLQAAVHQKPEPKFRSFRTPKEVLDWVTEHGQLIIKEDGEWRAVNRAETIPTGVFIVPQVPDPKKWKSVKTGAVFGIIE